MAVQSTQLWLVNFIARLVALTYLMEVLELLLPMRDESLGGDDPDRAFVGRAFWSDGDQKGGKSLPVSHRIRDADAAEGRFTHFSCYSGTL